MKVIFLLFLIIGVVFANNYWHSLKIKQLMKSSDTILKCGEFLGAKEVLIDGAKPYHLNYFHMRFDDELEPKMFRAFPEYSNEYYWKKLMTQSGFEVCFRFAEGGLVDDSYVIVSVDFKDK